MGSMRPRAKAASQRTSQANAPPFCRTWLPFMTMACRWLALLHSRTLNTSGHRESATTPTTTTNTPASMNVRQATGWVQTPVSPQVVLRGQDRAVTEGRMAGQPPLSSTPPSPWQEQTPSPQTPQQAGSNMATSKQEVSLHTLRMQRRTRSRAPKWRLLDLQACNGQGKISPSSGPAGPHRTGLAVVAV